MIELAAATAFPDCHDCARVRSGPAAACLACFSGQIVKPGPASCPICAQRCEPAGSCPNELCRSPRRRVSRIHAIGYQTGALRRAIYSYKYGGSRTWSVVFGGLLAAWLEQNMAADPPDLIVANPTFTGRQGGPGARGASFDHTEAVLRAAAAAAADPGHHWRWDTCTPAAIVKARATLRSADGQAWSKRVTGTELRDAVEVTDPGRTAGRFVLVYDDICTTGSQLDAVAGVLLDHGGAARVEGVVLARAPWRAGATSAS
jgi:predicted amidophosphoribosyltransferase